jgi:hypothetical protein
MVWASARMHRSVLTCGADLMLTVLGPILAQIVTASAGDRTEARYIAGVDRHYEASTSPRVGLSLAERHLTLSLQYGPSINVTPLESDTREFTLFHFLSLSAQYGWRHTTVSVGEGVGFGTENFYVAALAGGAGAGTDVPAQAGNGATANPTAGAPVTPPNTTGMTGQTTTAGTQAANQNLATNQIVHYLSVRSSVNVAQEISSRFRVGGGASYSINGATRADEQARYPITQGPQESAFVSYLPDARDSLTASANAQYSFTSFSQQPTVGQVGASTWLFGGSGSWGHVISSHTFTSVSAGAALTRTPLGGGYTEYSIYPTFAASITNHSLSLARGGVTFGFSASSAPVVDLVTGAVDPRLGFSGQLGWGLDRFSANLGVGSTFSLTGPDSPGAYRAVGAGGGLAYRFGAALSADTGVRAAWQTFEGQATIPWNYAVYVGVTIGTSLLLSH